MAKGKKKGKTKNLNQKIKRIVRGQIETKYKDIEFGTMLAATEQYATSAGSLFYLSGVAQGDDNNMRSGNVINPVELHCKVMLRFWVSAAGSNTYWGNPMRVVVFSYDCSNTATGPAEPVVSSILARNSTSTVGDLVFRPYNVDNRQAYSILYDKVVVPDHRARGAFQPLIFSIRKRLPKKIFYSNNTDTTASLGRNAIYMLVCSMFDEVVDTTSARYTIETRLKYKDA